MRKKFAIGSLAFLLLFLFDKELFSAGFYDDITFGKVNNSTFFLGNELNYSLLFTRESNFDLCPSFKLSDIEDAHGLNVHQTRAGTFVKSGCVHHHADGQIGLFNYMDLSFGKLSLQKHQLIRDKRASFRGLKLGIGIDLGY